MTHSKLTLHRPLGLVLCFPQVTHGSGNSYHFGHRENNPSGDAEMMRFMMRTWVAFVAEFDLHEHGLDDEPH